MNWTQRDLDNSRAKPVDAKKRTKARLPNIGHKSRAEAIYKLERTQLIKLVLNQDEKIRTLTRRLKESNDIWEPMKQNLLKENRELRERLEEK